MPEESLHQSRHLTHDAAALTENIDVVVYSFIKEASEVSLDLATEIDNKIIQRVLADCINKFDGYIEK